MCVFARCCVDWPESIAKEYGNRNVFRFCSRWVAHFVKFALQNVILSPFYAIQMLRNMVASFIQS